MAASLVAALVLGATLFWSPKKADQPVPATRFSVERPNLPQWVAGFERSAVDECIAVQEKFRLPDATMHAAIQILRPNHKYAAGQSRYDLTRYPTQVGRAFSLVAAAQSGTATNLNGLIDDLQARVVQGVRFPDEQPEGSYSSLQRELFNNLVVLAVIDLLLRRHDEPAVKVVFAALKHDAVVRK